MASLLLNTFYVITAASIVVAVLIRYFVLRERQFRDVSSSLHLRLFRILLPQDMGAEREGQQDNSKKLFLTMEQMYAGFLGLKRTKRKAAFYGQPVVSFEIALPETGGETVLYAAIPNFYASTFQKLTHSMFPDSRVEPAEDYNMFNAEGITKASHLVLERDALLPIHTYERIGHDPFAVIAGAFAKLNEKGEGAAIQILMRPTSGSLNDAGKKAAKAVREGKNIKEALATSKKLHPWLVAAMAMLGFAPSGSSGGGGTARQEIKQGDEEVARLITEKASRTGFDVNIRLLASSANEDDASRILRELEAAFLQFTEPQGNSFKAMPLEGRALERAVYNFSFRIFNPLARMYLTTDELASVFRFPYAGSEAPRLQMLTSREAPPPANLPKAGLLIGKSVFKGEEVPVYITPDDRRRHMYIVGQTGTGKTTLIKNMIAEDIEKGRGVCFLDPHGDDVRDILGLIPKERVEDVVYFDPADIERPMGLNFLEYDGRYPEQKTFIVNELLEIFNKLYDMSVAGGPMFEQYFRNATLLVMDDPSSGNTLLEISRVMVDSDYRQFKISRSSNLVVKMFWKQIAEKAGGEASLQNMVPYITSKFDTFLANEIMRPIIAQEKSSFRLREIMDNKKILLINLSKGRLGELNSYLLGLIIIGKVLMAALSRVDIEESKRPDFYLYIDEFQNVTTKSIATILSEARKYRLNLVMAHQFIGQLSKEIRDAVFGNVGTIVSFRVGVDDTELLQKQFAPVFTAGDLLNIDNFHAYIRLLINGKTTRPFNIESYSPAASNKAVCEAVRDLSRLKYGRLREEVETEIARRQEKFG
ncbi:MAG: hypothetical protein A3C80_03940 [Candidatus Ryanbacteria bacterium RIFCSPHIGHO2_02_FULL_45_43]|uniref:AAA+ ATPase domain-containing protein n=1 Tax=Candidatus Ryanbacteria bacterium RIFCSPHIGHO2_01_45_13 TaxID=1802112 RepID=A0A1G2FZR0_9BACT|nr:MAG: hypothetical protein A2718_01360 [Candidatus Ryanbacteria bacterium RIFCSPHIGHO2_01_FULL_44_130]OGZ43549.1 MAG: hypothetical protein A2W41_04430 [Candidatus Ryanbacteria bacterium RIFCSPHIGHO2_01_45_13]OGZ47925.1 MAG: hypothetical protein A3C80_03940 [Candidatus Ryanbacteria bacterium RIFCSPHIGHO2_02_FULL_45_43]OGZ49939.1 MAG: hypothetical protein A3E55_03975 [Candidatus Ryanbacteria bacterium RIFCSPHIGHO2_12_FULL_44_20]OGZ51048.1 MAG: hypothetical protein A3A17_03515 [Candidatus Ryanba